MSDALRPHDAALERLKGLHPKLIDLSLGRIMALLSSLGDPQRRLPPTIHVAGTNGKGSTVAYLRAMAQAQGLRVHAFTSPHLVRFAERIRLDGRLISDAALCDLLERVEAANAGRAITFFEITTAAALLAFAETPADILLLEVGLGGRFDATNVVDAPALSVITPVDFDHQDFLGSDLTRIAWEKAGVLKPGRTAVIGPQRPEALDVIIGEAERLGTRLLICGRDFDAYEQAGRLIYHDETRLLDLPPPALAGGHQFANAGTAVAAALTLDGPAISQSAIEAGLQATVWPARMQRLRTGPFGEAAAARGADLWLDGGHNPHAAKALAQTLAAMSRRDGRPTVVIVGLLRRKDAAGVLDAFKTLQGRLIFTGFTSDGAYAPDELAAVAATVGVVGSVAADPEAALQAALAGSGPPARIVIWGSLHLAGEILSRSEQTLPD